MEPTDLPAASPSVDLAFELRSKLFDQLAAMGVGGAGIVITLRSSLLEDASPIIWLGAIEFGLAALLSLTAQFHLIEAIFARTANAGTARKLAMAATMLMGMGVGTVGTSVFMEGGSSHAVQKSR